MIDRSDLLTLINNSGLARNLSVLRQAVMNKALTMLSMPSTDWHSKDPVERKKIDGFLLNSVGPAAASAAVEYAIRQCKKDGKLKDFHFNGSYVANVKMIHNDNTTIGDSSSFSDVLRQFLLPRYAYLDFDRLVDPRHNIDFECGYPKFITPIMYRFMYDRDDMARRVVDIYPDESWAVDPLVYETDDEDNWTPFELAWQDLCDNYNVLQYLYRIDRLAGIGHYGALLLGIDDGEDLEKPIEGINALGKKDPNYKDVQRQLLYMRPFDEYLSFIHMYETDVMHPRYGLPKFYNLVFLDMTIDAAGASIGTRLNRRVHWSRVIHIADNLASSLVFGIPRMQSVFNRLLDLRKIKGGSAEMFWKGAFPGISFEINPQFVADDPEFDADAFKQEVEDYANGLQRYLRLIGVSAKSLAPQVADPEKHVHMQVQAIASHFNVPLRIFLGSEEGRLASGQDALTWNKRLNRRLRTFVEPNIIRNFINRLIAIGIMPPPSTGKYIVGWSDLNTPTDEDKASLALKWTQAMSQYVATGMIHLISPMDYLTLILGLKPSQAKKIVDAIPADGLKKLKDVDPDQGAGQNGVRENLVSGGGKESSRKQPSKRDSNDKKIEGSSS